MSRSRLLAVVGIVAGMAIAGCATQGTPTAGTTTTGPTSGPTATESPTPPPTGGTGGSGSGGAGGTSQAPQPSGPARCSAAVLSGTVQPKDSAAGNRYAELVVTNTGSAPCTLYGYGGLQLIGSDGKPLPTTALRDEQPKPSLVTVAPGGHAAKLLHWGVVPTGSEPPDKPCQPNPAKLSIIPPDETQPFTVTWSLGPVCAGGTFHGSAYYKV